MMTTGQDFLMTPVSENTWVWKFCGLEIRWPQDRESVILLLTLAIGLSFAALSFQMGWRLCP